MCRLSLFVGFFSTSTKRLMRGWDVLCRYEKIVLARVTTASPAEQCIVNGHISVAKLRSGLVYKGIFRVYPTRVHFAP